MTDQEYQLELLQRDEQIKRLHGELMEYINSEKVMIAAGLISELKVRQAHEIVGRWKK